MKKLFSTMAIVLFSITFILAQRTPLQSGEKAPNAKFKDINGNEYKVADLIKDNDKVLLCFMRPVWCPVCNARTHELIENYESLKAKGYEVFVIFPTPEATMKEYAVDHKLPFTVISDYNEELYGLFQVEKDAKKLMTVMKSERGKNYVKKGRAIVKDHNSYSRKGDDHGPLLPADFVIDNKQKLLNVYYGQHMGDHLPLDTL